MKDTRGRRLLHPPNAYSAHPSVYRLPLPPAKPGFESLASIGARVMPYLPSPYIGSRQIEHRLDKPEVIMPQQLEMWRIWKG